MVSKIGAGSPWPRQEPKAIRDTTVSSGGSEGTSPLAPRSSSTVGGGPSGSSARPPAQPKLIMNKNSMGRSVSHARSPGAHESYQRKVGHRNPVAHVKGYRSLAVVETAGLLAAAACAAHRKCRKIFVIVEAALVRIFCVPQAAIATDIRRIARCIHARVYRISGAAICRAAAT